MKPIRVVHVVDSIARGRGGPPRVVIQLCEHLARRGCRVDVCTSDFGPRFGPTISVDTSLVNVHEVPCRIFERLRVYLPKGFGRLLARVADGADVIHSHGLWLSFNNDAARIATRRGIPHVISLHSFLNPAALRRSRVKKALARRMFVDRNLRRAACVHALAGAEMDHARALGLRNPMVVIPNGIDPASLAPLPAPDAAGRRWPELAGKDVILFLGRVYPIKGLRHLVEAWRRLAGEFDSWQLVIAGPDEVGHLAELQAAVRAGRIDRRVTFTGAVFDADRLALLSAAELFVLPSLSEGFSVAVLEALACRVPVLISTECNFDRAADAGAGLVVEPTAEATEAGLRRMLSTSPDRRRAMGHAGGRLVRDEYTWPRIAQQMLAVYRYLADGGDPPAWINLD